MRSSSLTLVVAVFGSSLVAHAGHELPEPEGKDAEGSVADPGWSSALLGTGLKTSDEYTDGHVFLTIPLWSTIGRDGTLGGDYLFVEPYTSVGGGGEVATSLGVSWRHLFSDQPVSALQERKGRARFMEEGWFVGGSVFADMLDTEHDNQFWQMGVGAEIGTRYLELRGNYYIPFSDEKLFAKNTSRQTFTSTSGRTNQQTDSELFARGNEIVQRDRTTETTSLTTTTTTVTTTTRLFEKGMEGWDAEGVLLVPWIDQWMDCRVNGGYLHFNNQPFGPQDGPTGPVRGWKAGAEVRPVPGIVLGSEWYQDERFTGSNWVVSVEFQIPLDRHWKEAFQMRPRHLAEHLAEPVHRQNDAVKVGDRSKQGTKVASQTSTRQTTQSGTSESVVANHLIFVNNGPATSTGIQTGNVAGTGTAEQPVDTVNSGAGLAGTQADNTGNAWTVYVQGGGANYTGTATITGSTHLFGSSQPLTVATGKTFGGTGPNPVLDGAIFADAVAHPTIQTVSVQGFTIQHGSLADGYAPIQITNVPTVSVARNVIQDAVTDAIAITANDTGGAHASSVEISENTITNSAGSGVTVAGSNGGASITARVLNNTITMPGGDGIGMLATGTGGTGATISATITGNTIRTPSFNGMTFSAANDGTSITATASNNTISNASGAGIYSESFGASSTTLTANNNTLTANASNSFDIQSANSAVATFTASGNQITQAGLSGVTLSSFDSSSLTATLDNNRISGGLIANINAIDSNSTLGTGMMLFITNNTLSDGRFNAIALSPSNSATLNATVTGNTVSNVTSGGGVDLEPHDNAVVTATVSNNSFTSLGSGGIFYSSSGTSGAADTLTADHNTFDTMGTDAIAVQASRPNTTTFAATGNQITGTGFNGFVLVTVNSATLNSTVIDNTIDGAAGGYGIAALSANNPVGGQSIIINSNTITNSATAGIGLQTVAPTGVILINPATAPVDNIITGSGLQSMLGSFSNSSGNIKINGVIYALPADAP